MRCSKAQKLINDHVDNLINIRQVQSLEKHMEGCASCRDLLADMRLIVHNAKELDFPGPSNDLWPGIKKEVLKKSRDVRIHERGLWGYFHLYSRGPAFTFSTLLMVVVLIPLLYFCLPDMRNTKNDQEEITLINYRIAEQQYQSAIKALDRAIETREAKLSPELMGVFKNNLAIIDESIRVCIQSIDEYPKIQETNKLLLICYRKKIELLNELKDITMQS